VNVPLLSAQIVTRIQNGSTLTTRTPVKHHHAARFRFVLKKIYVYIFFILLSVLLDAFMIVCSFSLYRSLSDGRCAEHCPLDYQRRKHTPQRALP